MSKPGDLNECYRTLELEPGASREDVERAHAELSKGWNPNRFGNDMKRRRRAEDKLRQINLAYERLLDEADFEAVATTAPAVAAPASAVPVPKRWSNPWWYMWIVAILLALAFLGVDSAQRMKSINSISGPMIGNAIEPAKDPNSLTGYYGNQHVNVMPALGTDGYHWIMQTERIVAGQEDARLRHVDYDGLNDGREVHWSSSLHWLAIALAWAEHVTSGTPMNVALQDVMPWANTTILLLLILIMPPIVAYRFGPAPAALLALGFVVAYPYYEFSFVGYFDHHGLAASSDMLMVLFLVGAGATCLRDEKARVDHLSPAERSLWEWLPDRRQARRWVIASAVAGGTGLWISTASIVPVMFGIGLAALAGMFWMSLGRKKQKNPYWKMDPTLWRVWGLAGACTSLFYYALEYLPYHFGWRLEVNHPLYAVAWFGAGDFICRVCQLMQGQSEHEDRTNPGLKWVLMVVDLLMIASIPLAIVMFKDSVFVIPDNFLMLLHKDYILEFRTFLFQMSFLQPVQVAGGISLIPLVCFPMVALLFFSDVAKPWKAVLLMALLPAGVMLLLALFYIRWLGIDCAVALAALVTVTLIVVRTWSDHSWGYIFAFITAVVFAALFVVLPVLDYGTMDDAQTALQIYMIVAVLLTAGLAAFAIFKVRSWKVYVVFGVTAVWQIFTWGWMTQTEWGRLFIFKNIFLGDLIMRSKEQIELLSTQQAKSAALALVIFSLLTAFISLPAIMTGVVGMVGFNWSPRETLRSIFLGLFVYFLAIVVLPFPLFQYLQWHTTRWNPPPTDLDLTQVVTRDVSQRLRLRLGDERGVIVSGPTTTTWMMYFGGFKGIGTLYWENIDGLKAAANVYSKNSADSYDLIKKYGVTHIAIFSWDAFAIEYARLAQGRTKNQDAPAGAFVLDLVKTRAIPSWLRPLPYRVPDHPKLAGSLVLLFEVVPEQSLEEAQVRIAEWLIAFGTADYLDKAEAQLREALQAHPNYLPALSLLAILQQSRGQTDAMHATVDTIKQHLDQASTLKFEDRVTLAIALFLGGDKEDAAKQTQAYLAIADEKSVRHLSVDRIANFLEMADQVSLDQPLPPIYDTALKLLPPSLQAQVMTERANLIYNTRPAKRAEAVALLRDVLKVQHGYEPALVMLARILSTSTDASLRNGKEALEFAKTVFDHTRAQNAANLDLLACAEAEAGNFEDAQFYESKAVQLADNTGNPEKANFSNRLDLFLKNQPYREP